MDERHNMSFRCFFKNAFPTYTTHYMPDFPVSDIPRWFDAYRFTHPNCTSISCKVWFVDGEGNEDGAYDEAYN